MKHLKLNEVSSVVDFSSPTEHGDISISSPAAWFFTDFEKVEPSTIPSSTSADMARLLMLKSHTSLKLVVDSDSKFTGVVTLDEVSDQRITAELSKAVKRESITVLDLMVPKASIKGFEFSEIENADIKSVIHYLKNNGQKHCLVIDKETNKIRGIFSVSAIAKKLGIPINVNDELSFYRVFSALAS